MTDSPDAKNKHFRVFIDTFSFYQRSRRAVTRANLNAIEVP